MKKYKILGLLIICLLGFQTSSVKAQSEYELLNIPFIKYGDTLKNALSGGLNDGIYSNADLNNDGAFDLLIYELSSKKMLPFLHENADYIYAPQYETIFPQVAGWIRVQDFNCDGIADLWVNDGADGVAVYSGAYDLNNNIIFNLQTENIQYNGQTILPIDKDDTPAFIDVDGDNDIDILNFGPSGEYLYYYQNQSQEMGWGCDSLTYILADECWGKFRKSTSIYLNDTCIVMLQDEDEVDRSLHVVPAFSALNLDGDDDIDLLLLDSLGRGLVELINEETLDGAYIGSLLPDFPNDSIAININNLPLASYVEINGDGIRDLVVAKFDGSFDTNHSYTHWYYQNTGTDDAPIFDFVQLDFMERDMVDAGMISAPLYWDYNNDGRQDIVIADVGEFDPLTFLAAAKLQVYENIGTASWPVFELVEEDFANLSTLQINSLRPSFGDIDDDGDDDIIFGDLLGKVSLLRNNAGVFDFEGALLTGIGFNTHPQLIDVNRDGLLDLIIGEGNGNLNYYENTGTATNPDFALISDFWGGVDVRFPGEVLGYSAPFLYPYGENGEYHLFVGCNNGSIYHYDNVEGNLSGVFSLVEISEGDWDEGLRSTVAVSDINNDTYTDFLLGNYRGGISVFSENQPIPVSTNEVLDNSAIQIYPNPVSGLLTINTNNGHETVAKLMDIKGRLLINTSSFFEFVQLPVQTLSAGLYILQIQQGRTISTHKIFIQ